nr:integrase, catalytic region, zinc finger, CCHC-type, peptidase aspartic, catalytic [Tanacetum cinerariifolium]
MTGINGCDRQLLFNSSRNGNEKKLARENDITKNGTPKMKTLALCSGARTYKSMECGEELYLLTWKNVSCKVDVDGIVDCEEDREDHEIESSGVVNNNIDLNNLVEVSKEWDKDDEMSSKDSSKVYKNKDNGMEENFTSDLGVRIYCVGSNFVEVTTILEKTNASVESIKEGTNLIYLCMNKEVICLVDFGCGESGENGLEMVVDKLVTSMILGKFKWNGRMILESIEHGLLIWPMVEENGVIRTKKYDELSAAKKIQADCDMKATNIILQGLPADIYSLVNHHRVAKDLWERVQLLMQGISLTKQERECKLYDAFDKFTHIKEESLHTLPPEWSKFVTDVKLVKDLHTSNYDQLHVYLEQHELHANESSYNNPQLQQQFSPSQQGSIQPHQHYSSHYPSQTQFNHSSIPPSHLFQSHMNHQTSTIPQVAYQSPQAPTELMTESPFIDSGFDVPVFSPGDDLIACLNKAMAFLTFVASLRFPSTNNQLRTSSDIRNQATIQDGRVTVQQARVVKCYNCQDEGHMARQCTQPKRQGNDAWYKEKAMLAEAQEAGQILDEEQLAFLVDPRIPAGQAQIIIPHNVAFQTEDLDTYDFDCNDLSNAQAVLMANISNYGSDVISEVVQIVLWYLDSGCSKHMTGNRSQLMNFVSKFLGTVRFGNDQIARIIGYGDYQLGNIVILRVYYVQGLGHNLFSVG